MDDKENKPKVADDKSNGKGRKPRRTSAFTPGDPDYPTFSNSMLGSDRTVFATSLEKFAEKAGSSTRSCARETVQSIKNLEKATMEAPPDLPARPTATATMMHEMRIKKIVERDFILNDNLARLTNILLSNCTPELRAELEAVSGFDAAEAEGDVISILKMIKELVYNFRPHQNVVQSVVTGERAYHKMVQGRHESTQDYIKRFKDAVEAYEHTFGPIGHVKAIILDILSEDEIESIDDATPEELEEAKAIARERYLAASLIIKANRAVHASLIQDLENREMTSGNAWPQTLSDAIAVLANWKAPKATAFPTANDGINFAMSGSRIICHRCGKPGHIAAECDGERKTDGKKSATSLFMHMYDSDVEDLYRGARASPCF